MYYHKTNLDHKKSTENLDFYFLKFSEIKPILTILLTSTKWSETASSVVLQLSFALFIEFKKLRFSE